MQVKTRNRNKYYLSGGEDSTENFSFVQKNTFNLSKKDMPKDLMITKRLKVGWDN